LGLNENDVRNGDWQAWRRYVIEALSDIREEQKETQKSINKLAVELAVLKVKAGFWGSVAGVVVAAGALLIDHFARG